MMADQRRSPACAKIPADKEAAMRDRLRLARTSRQMTRTDQDVLSAGTLTDLEMRNFSKARVGDLYHLALAYGMDPAEFFSYLFSGKDGGEVDSQAQNNRRLAVFMQSLPPQLQELVLDIVQRVVKYEVDSQLADEQQPLRERAPKRSSDAILRARMGISTS